VAPRLPRGSAFPEGTPARRDSRAEPLHRKAYFIVDEAAASKLSPEHLEELTGRPYAEPALHR